MRTVTRIGLLALILSSLCVASATASSYSYAVSGLLGVGGSLDETDAGLGNLNWQLGFNSEIGEDTHFAVRLGGVHWGSEDFVAEVAGPSLLYATLAGEYRETRESFSGSVVDPGVYIGLGFYNLDGENEDGESVSESAPGLVVGLTGDIALNKRRTWSLRLELAAHYAALDAAQLFGMIQVGVSYHF